jgi:hypothetical protein
MKAAKENGPQRPVDMTLEEMNELKRGNAEIISILHKRIVSASKGRKSKVKIQKQKKSSPVKLSAAQLQGIKKTGKIPRVIELEIIKERKYERPGTNLKDKTEKSKKPRLTPPRYKY